MRKILGTKEIKDRKGRGRIQIDITALTILTLQIPPKLSYEGGHAPGI